ncbi:MAG TPA: mechanosensitive ion channel family protein [Azospirillaceae bacterium]|nr:mechanosensitive ion channel family protein [Azospirillaceae bacterium]
MRPFLGHLAPPALVLGLIALALWMLARLPLPGRTGSVAGMALAAAAWMAVAWLAARLADLAFDRVARHRGLTQSPRLLRDLTRVVLFTLAGTAILAGVLHRPVAGLLATSGVLIAILGFALRNMIADVFSGIALNLEHPYRIGDWIEVAPGMVGRVDEIDWRATRLLTNDGTSITVPNGLVAGSRFVNHSFPTSVCRAAIRVMLDHGVPVERGRRVLLTAAHTAPRILADPTPDVVVDGITDQGVGYAVRYWLPDFGQEAACRDAVATRILECLRRAGLEPVRTRHELVTAADRVPSVPSVRTLLEGIDLFQAFEEAELDRLATALTGREVAAGTMVVRQGEPGASLFVVAEGVLDVLLVPEGRPALTLDRMQPGDVFGEMSLLTGQPRSASVVAVTSTLVYELDKETLDPLLRDRPELADRLAMLMDGRLRRNEERRRAHGRAVSMPPELTGAQELLRRLRGFFKLAA